jgi:hypothetical protein
MVEQLLVLCVGEFHFMLPVYHKIKECHKMVAIMIKKGACNKKSIPKMKLL